MQDISCRCIPNMIGSVPWAWDDDIPDSGRNGQNWIGVSSKWISFNILFTYIPFNNIFILWSRCEISTVGWKWEGRNGISMTFHWFIVIFSSLFIPYPDCPFIWPKYNQLPTGWQRYLSFPRTRKHWVSGVLHTGLVTKRTSNQLTTCRISHKEVLLRRIGDKLSPIRRIRQTYNRFYTTIYHPDTHYVISNQHIQQLCLRTVHTRT